MLNLYKYFNSNSLKEETTLGNEKRIIFSMPFLSLIF